MITFCNIASQEDEIIFGEEQRYIDMGISFDDEDHSCYVQADFHDGYAEMLEYPQYLIIYPTIKAVKKNKRMAEAIVDYTGRDEIVPFDIALKYGEIIKI